MATISLKDKRILITGGARGLGQAFAEAAIAANAQVMIADVLENEGKKSAKQMGAIFTVLDLRDPKSVSNCAEQTIKSLGGLDGLVNCGAIATGIGGPTMSEIDIDVWDKVMEVNVRGTWLMSKAVIPYLAKNKSSKIVNIASDTAMWGAPKLMAYVASKGAIISMTRSMSRELGADNIAVNCIAPGLTLVEATEYVPEDRKNQYVTGRAIQRGQLPEDVTGTVMFLLSNAANFVTGQCIPVNGGFFMN
ncbi:MAG TPA: SDR family oxidoreductase [Rhodospirillales bacterium]|jgi:NAD(P)-dependent dehydrogenase (short-subunit alcohol dehydrogenase family)|nr:SDR family oxidoreductase [Rhodospirillales bacterium]HIL75151.1 SDR family oxidoreductase [Rhodospirillales bacterium]